MISLEVPESFEPSLVSCARNCSAQWGCVTSKLHAHTQPASLLLRYSLSTTSSFANLKHSSCKGTGTRIEEQQKSIQLSLMNQMLTAINRHGRSATCSCANSCDASVAAKPVQRKSVVQVRVVRLSDHASDSRLLAFMPTQANATSE